MISKRELCKPQAQFNDQLFQSKLRIQPQISQTSEQMFQTKTKVDQPVRQQNDVEIFQRKQRVQRPMSSGNIEQIKGKKQFQNSKPTQEIKLFNEKTKVDINIQPPKQYEFHKKSIKQQPSKEQTFKSSVSESIYSEKMKRNINESEAFQYKNPYQQSEFTQKMKQNNFFGQSLAQITIQKTATSQYSHQNYSSSQQMKSLLSQE